jgi:hypothetical protein
MLYRLKMRKMPSGQFFSAIRPFNTLLNNFHKIADVEFVKVFIALVLLTTAGATTWAQPGVPSFSLDQLSKAATTTPLPDSKPAPDTKPVKAAPNAPATTRSNTAPAKPAGPAKAESIAEIKRKAEAGDPKGRFALAEQFQAMQKYSAAEYWYRQAGLQGEPQALYALAEMYRGNAGSGTNMVKGNLTNTITLHKLAAALGYPKSHYQLGLAYKTGIGIHKDPSRAYFHFKLCDASSRDQFINQLIAELSQEQLDAADKLVAAFKPAKFRDAFANLVFESVQITGIFGTPDQRMAMLNGKPVNAGQQVELNVGGLKANVKFAEISNDGVFVTYNSMERKIKPQRL